MGGIVKTDEGKLQSRFVGLATSLVVSVCKTAKRGAKALSFLMVLGFLGYLGVMSYFWLGLNAGWKLMLLPGVLMLLPLLGLSGFTYMLFCLSDLPESMKEAIVGLLSIKGKHRERLEKLEKRKGLLPSFRKVRLTCGLLWDILWNAQNHGETYGDAQMALWMLTPWFWIVVGISGGAMLLTQLSFGIFCVVHWVL